VIILAMFAAITAAGVTFTAAYDTAERIYKNRKR